MTQNSISFWLWNNTSIFGLHLYMYSKTEGVCFAGFRHILHWECDHRWNIIIFFYFALIENVTFTSLYRHEQSFKRQRTS